MLKTLAIVAALTLAAPVSAQNLITNGDFQTGTLAGWTTVGDVWVSDPQDPVGDYELFAYNPWGVDTYAEQLIPTTPGQTYRVSFRLRGGVFYSWVVVRQQIGSAEFQQFGSFLDTPIEYDYVAIDSTTNVRFMFSGYYFTGLDNVAVQSLTAAAVPEPDAWALMIAGVFVTGAALRGSKRNRALHESHSGSLELVAA